VDGSNRPTKQFKAGISPLEGGADERRMDKE
jgi:hypothetical protein